MTTRLSGMTGFARVAGEADWGRWAWEVKSVNGRGLDVRLALPPGFERLESLLKAAVKSSFHRGSVQASLRLTVDGGRSSLSVDNGALDALIAAWSERQVGQAIDGASLASLMNVRGVVETATTELSALAEEEATLAEIQAGGEQALEDLKSARLAEGASLASVLDGLLDQMSELRKAAEDAAADQPALQKARLQARLAEIKASDAVDPDRLAAEVALSAAKADVREELDRLAAHIESGRGHLREGGPKGRQLDFLTQELNREANTLCSKSASLDLTNAGLSLKAVIDQFKEQSANVE